MPKISAYPVAATIAPTDPVIGNQTGVTKQIPVSLIRGNPISCLALDYPPASPHAKDDDFLSVALDAKWTNPATSAAGMANTIVLNGSWITIEPATAGTGDTGKRGVFGIRQTAPAGAFSVMAKVEDCLPTPRTSGATDNAFCGIFVGVNTGKFWWAGIVNTSDNNDVAYAIGMNRAGGGAGNSDTDEWGTVDFSQINNEIKYNQQMAQNGRWFKIVHTTTASGTLQFFYSSNGIVWNAFSPASIITGVQPNRIGIGIWNGNPSIRANHIMACDWFRVTEP